MAQPTYTYKVNTPFAINGSKDEIPTTTEDGSVSLENGYGTLYETPPSEGGRFIRRGEWNYLINFLYNAVKELQDIITAGEFTVSASQTLTSILPIALGGTGADTAEGARNNLGVTEELSKKVNKSGDTMTGKLTVNAERIQVDNGGVSSYLTSKNATGSIGVIHNDNLYGYTQYVNAIAQGQNYNYTQWTLKDGDLGPAIFINTYPEEQRTNIRLMANSIITSGPITELGHRLSPMPISSVGSVGQFIRLSSKDPNSLTLPDGGSWVVYRDLSSADYNYFVDTFVGFFNGGSDVSWSGNAVFGFAWRLY